tara:strand:+ start:628 stop:873 length:246 start_codon:yes stop_codon:yes gene_type:complete
VKKYKIMKKNRLKEIVGELKNASKMHLSQSKEISKHIDDMKSPLDLKISSSCKTAAKRKFDVYPSAYANMWASKQQKKGKC